MSARDPDDREEVSDFASSMPGSGITDPDLAHTAPHDPPTGETEAPVPWPTVALIVAAAFGSGLALVVPMVFSMAIRLAEIAPGSEQALGYILGVGASVALITAPLSGIISDRTRTRWGRRKPFAVIGIVIGLAAVPILAFATTLPILGLGWLLTSIGWGTAGGSVGNILADRLPERQRGQVSGLTNLAGQIAPVVGILLAGLYTTDAILLFLVPASIGAAMVALFVIFVPEPDSRDFRFEDRLTVVSFFQSLVFDPREHPIFAWVLAGRFFFFFGMSLTIAYGTYFYSQRLGVPVVDVAGVMAVISAVGIAAAALGAVGAGWLSDRWGSRSGWVALSTMLFAAGCVLSAFAWSFPLLIAGALISNLGIAAFGSVGQALVLDVLPFRQTQAGRFGAIASYSQRVPSALAPLTAPLLLGLAASSEFQYTVLYLAAAASAVLGGVLTFLFAKAAA